MAQATLNQILAHLETLELEQLKQLAQAIQKHIADKQETAKRVAFHQALLASGLVKQLKQPSNSRKPEQRLIQLQDKPISETITKVRR